MSWPNFKRERLDVIGRIERHHFWFHGRRQLVQFALGERLDGKAGTIADIGCGTGFNLQAWGRFGDRVLLLDRLSADVRDAGHGRVASWAVCGDVRTLPLAADLIDLVIALDVLEHVPDALTLAECHRVLRSGGMLFLTVPAIPWLWSFRDDDAGHLRRYTRRSLLESVSRAGFAVEYIRFYQFLLLPIVIVSRLLGGKGKRARDLEDKPHPAVNAVLRAVTGLEVKLIKLGISFPIGSSLLMVARKL
jgi:SAM-dependent methyltransferase